MKKGQRFTTGFFGSIVLHISILLFFGISLYLYDGHVPKTSDQIVEVSLVSCGGASSVGQASALQNTPDKQIKSMKLRSSEAIVEHKDNIQEQIIPRTKEQEVEQKESFLNNHTGSSSVNEPESNSGSEVSGQGTIGLGDNIEVGEPMQPPRLISRVQPDYPSTARQNNIEGTTYVRLLVSANGDVEAVSVANSSGSEVIDAAAVTAAYQWRFIPAKNERGSSVRCYVRLPIAFRLR